MRVLLVEYDATTARWARRALEESGHRVESVPATLANDRADADAFGLILIACEPPSCAGADVARAARRTFGRTPLLIVSERASEGDVARALDAGADDYVVGPPSATVLQARVRTALRRATPRSPDTLVLGDLGLDLTTGRVHGPGGTAALTAREYALLEYLMRHAGEVVARQRLLTHVWGYEFDPGTNVVEVALSRLRQKLADVASRVSVRTVRRLGVTIEMPGETPGGVPEGQSRS